MSEFEAHIRPDEPGDRFARSAADSVVGKPVTVVVASGRRVQGEVVAARVDDAGNLYATISVDTGLSPLAPCDYSLAPDTPDG
jgi:hypothetical protein